MAAKFKVDNEVIRVVSDVLLGRPQDFSSVLNETTTLMFLAASNALALGPVMADKLKVAMTEDAFAQMARDMYRAAVEASGAPAPTGTDKANA